MTQWICMSVLAVLIVGGLFAGHRVRHRINDAYTRISREMDHLIREKPE